MAKSVDGISAAVLGRRNIATKLLAALASGGMPNGGAATLTHTIATSSDANLLSLCAQFDRMENRWQKAVREDTTAQQEELTDALLLDQPLLLEQICRLPATTIEGLAAIAASLLLWDGELSIMSDDADAPAGKRLQIALLRSVLNIRL